MSCGNAVIGANSPGIKEIINDEINGVLCNTDSYSIMKKIKYLMKNPDKIKAFGIRAREDAVRMYSLKNIAESEFDLYKKTIS